MLDLPAIVDQIVQGVVAIDRPDGGWGASGFYVNEKQILTVNHAFAGRSHVRILRYDGSEYDAMIVERDREHDLGLLLCESPGPVTKLAPPPRLGQQVICVGCPYGYPFSVSCGIVSGVNRKITMPTNDVIECIQTDAPVNPGNSGGPLFGYDGQVVGMVFAQRDGAENIGFAMTSEWIRCYLTKLTLQTFRAVT